VAVVVVVAVVINILSITLILNKTTFYSWKWCVAHHKFLITELAPAEIESETSVLRCKVLGASL
jgi:hypothetical protein